MAAKKQARATEDHLAGREARRRMIAIAVFGAAYIAILGIVLMPEGYLRETTAPLAVLHQP